MLAQNRHGGIISKDVVSTAGSENHWKTCGLRHVFVSSMVRRLVAIYGLRIYTHTYIQWRRWDYCYLVRALSLLSISGRTLKKKRCAPQSGKKTCCTERTVPSAPFSLRHCEFAYPKNILNYAVTKDNSNIRSFLQAPNTRLGVILNKELIAPLIPMSKLQLLLLERQDFQ